MVGHRERGIGSYQSPLPIQDNADIKKMLVEFELTIQVLEVPKTAHVMDCAVIVIVQTRLFLDNYFVIIIIAE